MKRTVTFKTLLVCASVLSLSAFAFVNLNQKVVFSHSLPILTSAQPKAESDDMDADRELQVPDVSVIGRVYGIAQKLWDKAN
jgi:hypothetical protein